jgi:hypothetical protein
LEAITSETRRINTSYGIRTSYKNYLDGATNAHELQRTCKKKKEEITLQFQITVLS